MEPYKIPCPSCGKPMDYLGAFVHTNRYGHLVTLDKWMCYLEMREEAFWVETVR